ncbi:MAG: N-acetyl sugar amidotransferase [Candidatus Hodarchaeota archaeon]
MRRCAKCVLPEICPKIEFDKNGICNVCNDFDKQWSLFKQNKPLREKKLNSILNNYKNKNEKYDFLVPISGGLDSIYVLYVCKLIYNLRLLAFNFNNGFQTKIAKDNIENAIKKLDVDYITVAPPWQTLKKLYALFFRKTGEFCTPCNVGIWSMSYKIAKNYNIPVIVSGASNRIGERLPKGGRIYSWSPSYFREVIRGEIPVKDVKEFLHLPQNFHNLVLQKNRKIGPQVLNLPDYIDWDINSISYELRNELNWKQKDDKYHHIDCIMESVNDYFKQKKWSFSSAIYYSMLVRNKHMIRDEALKKTMQEEENNSKEPSELKLWLKLLNLSREDLEGFEKRDQSIYFI